MQASAQRLRRLGVNMFEFPQSVPNLTRASQNLFELIKSQGIMLYPEADIRLAVQRSVAIEGTRGWRIAKDNLSQDRRGGGARDGGVGCGAVGQRDRSEVIGLPVVFVGDRMLGPGESSDGAQHLGSYLID
jgi:hypothetical protein